MRWTETIKSRFKGMGESVVRFPLTVLFLIAGAILNSLMIENTELDFTRFIYTFLVGALLSVVGQMLYERFFSNPNIRYGLMLGAVAITIGYYFAVGPQYEVNTVIFIKTFVALFALLIAFIWIPSINNEAVPFHRSFLSVVKAFFVALLFSMVLAAGISAIYSAADYLLFDIDPNILGHLLNIVGTLFAPIYFLSMTPVYPIEIEAEFSHKETLPENEKLMHQFTVPRFLEILIAYIVIPLVAIYTLILVLYVVFNITGEFWTNNLLEPLLVSYAIIVIIVLILSYNIENRYAVLFRQIFPKILVPIVVFQTIASILKIREMGITHGRYYVILFGIFATITGLIFSFMKPKNHGYIAAVLLFLAALSIVPPVDAFTLSKRNQINLLEETLRENNMLEDDGINPNSEVAEEERVIVTKTATYINDMGYNDEVDFLPENFDVYNDFRETFGFNMTYDQDEFPDGTGQYAYLNREEAIAFPVSGADVLVPQMLSYSEEQQEVIIENVAFAVDDENYELERRLVGIYYVLTVKNEAGEELISYNLEEVFNEIFAESTSDFVDQGLSINEATITSENEMVALEVLVLTLERADTYNNIEFNLLIDIK